MIPLRLVIDTDMVVSAALKPAGLKAHRRPARVTKPARPYVSNPVLAEYTEVLSRPELKTRKGLQRQLIV